MHIVLYVLDGAAKAIVNQPRSNRVVIVKVDAIGDFVLWLEFAQYMRDYFKEHEIVLVANHLVVELANRLDHFDQVIGVNLKSYENDWGYRFRLNREISRLGADTAIQPTYSRKYFTGDSLVRATCASKRIGSVGDMHVRTPWQRFVADRWFTKLIPASKATLHEMERNKEFLKGLEIVPEKKSESRFPELLSLPSSLTINDKYFVVFPGAGISEREWPVESFGTVARFVVETYGWRMVVCGSAGEKKLASKIITLDGLSTACDLTGKTSLPELVEVIRGARLLIANETSAVHIAAAVETPVVCLLGGGHFGRFVPYPDEVTTTKPVAVYEKMDCYCCDWHCIYQVEEGRPFPCIEAIDKDAVIDAVKCTIKGIDD